LVATRAAGGHYWFMPASEDDLIPTRASLLKRLRDWQDQASWDAFFQIYWKLIYGVARKAGLNDAEAQDVVQETMTSVAKHMPTFRYDPALGSFKAWLLKLTRWRIVGQFRKREPNVALPPVQAEASTETGPIDKIADPAHDVLDTAWENEWEKTLMKAALEKVKRRLDPQKYQIFDFYVNKEWPPEKVAETFGIPVGQVYLAKHRVTAMLKREIHRLETEAI
jgi:RNA polymerase sigma-70 factor (ECF subfamily)